MSNFFEVSLVFLYIFYAVGASSLPTYVTRCLNGTFDGTNLIQVNCTSHADLGQFPISYNLNNGVINTSDTTTPTRIQNCQFNGCGNIYTTAPLLFQNVVFNHSSFGGVLSQTAGGGGAVTVVNTNVSFLNVTFIGCRARQGGGVYTTGVGATITMLNVNALQNTATNAFSQGGGVLYAEAGTQVIVSQSTFANNSAMFRGGSFFIDSNSNLTLLNCTFVNGSATFSRGGDVHVEAGSILTWTYGSSTGPSGPLTEAALNSSSVASGGSISLLSATAQLSNLQFQGHRVSYYGGVLYSLSSNVLINNIQTSDTAAALDGGVAYLFGGQNNVTILLSTFTAPYAVFCGGTIYNDGLLNMSGINSFNSTIHRSNGGFLYDFPGANTILSYSNIIQSQILSQSNVDGSRSDEFGGGIYTNGASLIISHSIIMKSSATYGGAVAIMSDKSTSSIVPIVLVTNSNLTFNTALSQGGAIMVGFCANLTINDSNLNLNSAVQSGGAVLLEVWQSACFTTLTGAISISNNSITGPSIDTTSQTIIIGGGGIGMDTQAALNIATANLIMTGNEADMGSAIYCNVEHIGGSSLDTITYTPTADDLALGRVLNIQGTVYIAKNNFAAWMAANNPFPASANIRLDSPPCRLSAANSTKLSAVNGSILGLDLKVPDVAFNIDNAFGTPIAYVQWTNVTIVQAVFQTTNTKQQGGVAGNVIYRMYKGPTSQSKGVVYFRNVSLAGVNLKYGFTGGFSIVYSVLLGSSSAATSGASSLGSISISYQIQGCEVPYYTQVESGMLLSDGSMSYACLPIINIDNLTNLIAGGLSSVLLLMTLLMGISAIRRSRQSSEETDIKRTAFSNHLIALGCLLHIATGVTYFVQSGASCIAAQWLDLTSFTLLLLIIIFKTSQVKTIFLGSARLGGFERPISNTEIGVFIVIYEVLVILFLISWTIFGPIEMLDKQVVWLPGYVQNQVCSTNGLTSMFQIVEIIWKFGLLSISLRQSYHTRYIQSVYAESFPLAWVTYIWAVCYLILYPIDLADSIYPITRLTVQLVRILLPSSLTTIILLSNIENVRSVLSRMSGTAMDSNFDSFNRIYAYFRTSDPLATAEAKHLGARFFPTTASDRLEINSLRKNVGTPSSGLLSGATETSKSFSSFTDEGGSNAFLSLKNPHQSSVNYR